MADMPHQSKAGSETERVRHLKRGTEYEVLDRKARLQTDKPIGDDAEVVVYRSASGMTWVRPLAEMNDGRFETIAAAPAPPIQGGVSSPLGEGETVGEWTCAARRQGTAGGSDPADCDWPTCGCDPYADKVIAALQECGHLVPASLAALGTGEGSGGAAEFQPKIETCPKCGVQGVAFICDTVGCPVNGGAAYPWTEYPTATPTPDPRKEALAVLEGLSPMMSLEEHVRSLRLAASSALSQRKYERLVEKADRIEAALATLTAQDQAGEVK